MSRLDRLVEVVLIGVYRTYDNLLRKSRIWSDSVSKAFGIIAPLFASKDPGICLEPVISRYNPLAQVRVLFLFNPLKVF